MTAVLPLDLPRARRIRRLNAAGLAITLLTVLGAVLWAFPLYWGIVTSLKPEQDIVRPGLSHEFLEAHHVKPVAGLPDQSITVIGRSDPAPQQLAQTRNRHAHAHRVPGAEMIDQHRQRYDRRAPTDQQPQQATSLRRQRPVTSLIAQFDGAEHPDVHADSLRRGLYVAAS